jgi:hypothetical protein
MSAADEAVRRVLARDNLLMMAIDADEAVGIVRQRETLARLAEDEASLFEVALEHHLGATADDNGWADRSRAWRYAGVIVRFGEMVDRKVRMPLGWESWTSARIHEQSMRALFAPGEADLPDAVALDPGAHVSQRWRAARDLRLGGAPRESMRLSHVSPENDVYAAGAELYLGYLLFETGAAYVELGQSGQVDGVLRELDSHWRTRAATSEGRYRTDFVRAIANWDAPAAATDLVTAFKRVQRRSASAGAGRDLEELSVTLARAEHLARHESSERDRAKAILLAGRALRLAERVQGRWRVIARSRAPLAVVFQRIYGDIARLAAGLDGPGAAELGLRVALSAKQSGFAARMRTDRTLLSPRVEGIITDIMDTEDKSAGGSVAGQLDQLRFELAEEVSPMLADTVLPVPPELGDLYARIGDRHALDYVELTDSLGGGPQLFRCLVRPGGQTSFEDFTPDQSFVDLFTEARETRQLAALLNASLPGRDRDLETDDEPGDPGDRPPLDWLRLARQILPADLLEDLAGADPDAPIELLISAHSWLSLIPWPALEIADDERRPRLIERAVLTQTPVFTCLHEEKLPPVTGAALVRLVGRTGENAEPRDGVHIERERIAWGLGPGDRGVPLSQCPVAGPARPQPVDGNLADALKQQKRWGFAHLASHGDGEGLSQYLRLPGERMSFGTALTLHWPESVLMASCHVGQVINAGDAEPLNLVMALLSRGARCVVAGITSIDDEGTGRIAERIVGAIRKRPVSLAVALRDAQRTAVDAGEPVRNWALLGAYVQ